MGGMPARILPDADLSFLVPVVNPGAQPLLLHVPVFRLSWRQLVDAQGTGLRRRFLIAMAVFAVALSACAGAPKFREHDYVRMESLFYAVEQELCRALAEIESDPRVSAELKAAGVDPASQYAKATVSLDLVRVLDADGSVTFVIPVTGGTFGTDFSGSLTQQKVVNTSVSVYYPFSELECGDSIHSPPPEIAGGLGLWQWVLNTTVALINVRETPAAYSYEVRFSIFKGASGRPTFGVSTGAFRLIGGSARLFGSEQITHTLNITVRDVSLGEAKDGGIPPNIRDELDREESLTILRRIRD